MYEYYESFCNCDKRNFTKLMKTPENAYDERTPKINTFGKCPLNELASLIGRHLASRVVPKPNMMT